MNLVMKTLLTLSLLGSTICFAQDGVSKYQAKENLKKVYTYQEGEVQKVIESSKKNKSVNRKLLIKNLTNYYDSLINDDLISHTQKEEALEEILKMSLGANTKYISKKVNSLTFTKPGQCLKETSACSISLDSCCGGSTCSNIAVLKDDKYEIRTQCIKQLTQGQSCDPQIGGCLQSRCTLISNHTDASLCSIGGQACSDDSSCCSNSCDKSTNRCKPNYKCSNCVEIGGSINSKKNSKKNSKTQCCDGLFPNTDGVCEPIYPVENKGYSIEDIFSLFLPKLQILVPVAHASSTTDSLEAEIENLLSSTDTLSIKANLTKMGLNSSKINTAISVFQSEYSSCSSAHNYNNNYQSCLSSVKTKIQTFQSKTIQQSAKIEKYEKNIEGLKEEIAKIPDGPGLDGFSGAFNDFNKRKKQCVNFYSSLTSTSKISSAPPKVDSCLSNLQEIEDQIKQSISDLSASNMYMMSQFDQNGKAMDKEFFMQGKNIVDHSLYDGYDAATPILGNISVSEMNSCRVNLFGDYLAKQSDEYFKVMMTLLGMDYVTSGQGVEDYFKVDHWALQTFGVEDDIVNFDVKVGGNNSTAQTFANYGSEVKKEINNYYKTLNDEEKIIWSHLFHKSFLEPKEKKAILDYYIVMANGEDSSIASEISAAKSQLESALTTKPVPEASSYNLYRITRFESVKFKMYLYKMYGILKRKSVEMTCRCVDTLGPMNGDDWLEKDVEKQYLTFCGGLGKYSLFVMANDSVCSKQDASGTCIDAEHPSFGKKVLEAEEKKYVDNNINCTKDAAGNCTDTTASNFNSNDGSNVKNQLASSYSFNKLSELKISSERVSKFDKFVKNGKVTFDAERDENKSEGFVASGDLTNADSIIDSSTNNNRADGDGLKFTAFLRDMAIMKVEALSKVAQNNIFSITSTLTLTSQFVSTFNWGYRESNAKITEIKRKYLYPQLWLAKLMQFIFGGGEAGGFSYSYFKDDIKVLYKGDNSFIKQRVADSVNSLSPRPYKICEKTKYKKKTWKIKIGFAKVPIGQIWYWRCVNYEKLANKICNSKMPVGMCMKTVYAHASGGNVDFILDPFIPEGTGLIKDDKFTTRFSSGATVRELDSAFESKIKQGAKDYLNTQVFDFGAWSALGTDKQTFSNDEVDDFSNLVFEYHFIKPKKSYYLRYGTPGLVPYYKQLTDNAHHLSLSILDDLIMTSSYALKMHNFYYNVRSGLRTGLIMDQDQLSEFQVDPINYSAVGVGDFLVDLGSSGVSSNGFEFTLGGNGLIQDAKDSTNPDISGFANSLSAMSDYDSNKKARQKKLQDYMKSKGKQDDLDKMKEKIALQNADKNRLGKKFGQGLKGIANHRMSNSRLNFTTGGRGLVSSYNNRSDDLNSGATSDSQNDSSMSVKGSKNASMSGRSSRDGKGASANSQNVDDFSDFSLDGLEGESVNGFTLGTDGPVFNKKSLKNYISEASLEESNASEAMRKDPEWERNGITIFKKISTRYKKTAFPKFLRTSK